MTNIENRIRELGFVLPESVNPIASYIPATIKELNLGRVYSELDMIIIEPVIL